MKIFVGTLIIASAASAAMAQEQPASKAPAEAARIYNEAARSYSTDAKIVAELASRGTNMMKNSPLSGDEVNESVQTLGDGNRIVRNSTGKFYRNSEGRIRREGSNNIGGMFGTTFLFGQGVSITSPVAGQQVLLNSELKTARVLELGEGKQLTITGAKPEGRIVESRAAEERNVEARRAAELTGKLETELRAFAPMASQSVTGFGTTIAPIAGQYAFAGTVGVKYETNIEELGQRDFEGVMAEGTRRTTIIPAGAIGNERPIEVVYERWFSKDIGMVVYSKNVDPRFGEQIYKLTNIVRSEPDPSLFAVPTTYKKVSENGTVYNYKVGTPLYPASPAKVVNGVKVVPVAAKTTRP